MKTKKNVVKEVDQILIAEDSPTQAELLKYLLEKHNYRVLVAKDGKESLLSLGVKAYGTPKYISTVAKGNFIPIPKVDSAIISIETISRNNFENVTQEKRFFSLVKKAFGQKRKMVAGTLGVKAEDLEKFEIKAKARPEELTVKNWLDLSEKI